jgi:hypothetical protein
MESNHPGRNRGLTELITAVDRGTSEERAFAVGRLFGLLVPAIPAPMRNTPIELVDWSQPFVGNQWWREVWDQLGVSTVADLAPVGAALARTRGIGRGKLLLLIQDLVTLAQKSADAARGVGPKLTPVELIQQDMAAIERGPAVPQPRLVKELLETVIAALPPKLRNLEVKTVPWTTEWCYTTSLWSDLGVKVVADLANVSLELTRARGIGKWKILTIAKELMFLSPELYNQVFPPAKGRKAKATGAKKAEQQLPPESVVAAIDRLAGKLRPRERDILRRRIGWRYHREPEKLRTLAEAHGVSQERIRQIENLILKRIGRIVRAKRLPAVLREAMGGRSGPIELATLVATGRPELQGLNEVWRPMAEVLEAEGGPYLFVDPRQPGKPLVATSRPKAGRDKEPIRPSARSSVAPLKGVPLTSAAPRARL